VAVFLATISCSTTIRHRHDGGTGGVRKPAAVITSVCAITADPQAFDNRRVTVDACIATDDYEYRFLFDEHSDCRGPGLVPLDSSAGVSANLKNGECGVFTGQFHWNQHPFIVYQSHLLNVETVAGVHNKLKKS
jgi:hypothetical protein